MEITAIEPRAHAGPAGGSDEWTRVVQRFVEISGRPYDERLPMAWTS